MSGMYLSIVSTVVYTVLALALTVLWPIRCREAI